MNLVLLLTGLLLGNSSTHLKLRVEQEFETTLQQSWKQYKLEFDKNYESDAEDLRRMEIFAENSRMIEEHNGEYERGVYSYELGHNQFSDMTYEEYLELYSNYQESTNDDDGTLNVYNENPTVQSVSPDHPTVKSYDHPTVKSNEEFWWQTYENEDSEEQIEENYYASFEFQPPSNVALPYSIDWRRSGAVTPVKDEGHCRASWAFSATGALESQLFRRYHTLTPLSEQNLLDCTAKYGNRGCKNGTSFNAYQYIIANRGIDTNATYPWRGKKAWICHYKKVEGNPTVHGIALVSSGNETALANALAFAGPVAVAVDARGNKFRFYSRGIYHEPFCSSHILTREMLAVGYDSSMWIVKNSWGNKWGSAGYIYMARNGRNQCGIATRALYPIV